MPQTQSQLLVLPPLIHNHLPRVMVSRLLMLQNKTFAGRMEERERLWVQNSSLITSFCRTLQNISLGGSFCLFSVCMVLNSEVRESLQREDT